MKDRAVFANTGHFNVERDIPALKKMSKKVRYNVRKCVDEYVLRNNIRW
jgi:adenosylhomocysteinase